MTTPAELDIPAKERATIAELMQAHGYTSLKKTQAYAFNQGILEDGNDLLVAETGNGKTLTAEAIAYKHLKKDNRVAYLVPSNQLVWSKKETIQKWAGDDYSVYSGQNKYRNADIAVGTFESFYQAILEGREGVNSIDAIILDDFHELYSDFRGNAIELAISAALYGDNDDNDDAKGGGNAELYGISATLGNPDEIGDWMNADVHISPEDRQTPIKETAIDSSSNSTKQHVVDTIEENPDKSPYLVFCFAKSWTESRAEALAEADILEGPSKDRDIRAELTDRIDGVLTESHKEIIEMIKSGVAYIHADLSGKIKRYVLDLYENGEIEAITTTTSLAYGFDSPVQSVIIADITRMGEYVGVYEYVQWAGRAARPRFNYDTGYCYTLTNDTEETADRYFSPDRELEDVKTHIDNDEQFRWLVLELVANGWDTTEDIEKFIHETLYWEQMTTENPWGRGPETKQEKLESRLDDTTEWLDKEGFISERSTEQGFTTTSLGRGAVDFHYGSFVNAELGSIKSFYNWIEDSDHNDIRQLDYIYRVVTNFDLTLRTSGVDGRLESAIKSCGYDDNEAGITTGLIRWYWMGNYSMEQIEDETEIDATYLPGLAQKVSNTIRATKYVVEAAPNARTHEWTDDLVFRVDKGIQEDAIPIVADIDALGRVRIRFLRTYLEKMARQTLEVDADNDLWTLLTDFYNHTGSEEKFVDVLIDQTPMIGKITGKNLAALIKEGEIEITNKSTSEENALTTTGETANASAELGDNNSTGTHLGDF